MKGIFQESVQNTPYIPENAGAQGSDDDNDSVKTLGIALVILWLLKIALMALIYGLWTWFSPWLCPRYNVELSAGRSVGYFWGRLLGRGESHRGVEVDAVTGKIKYQGVLYARVPATEEET